jgi:hypothetical protein
VAGFVSTLQLLRGEYSAGLLMDALLTVLPNLTSPAGNAGGVVMGGYFSLSASQGAFSTEMVFNGSTAAANAAMAPLLAFVTSNPLDFNATFAEFFPAPSMNAWHDAIDPGDPTGVATSLGSRLIPAAVAGDPGLRGAVVDALVNISYYTPLSGMMVVGGAVAAADPASAATCVTPAWRNAMLHLGFGIGWGSDTPIAEQDTYFDVLTAWTGALVQLMPDSGAYWSESDYLATDWATAYWGDANYARLQGIKAVYDPTGLFGCHNCVQMP